MKINPEVKKALEEGRAVVALESTIISHGMPYPRNVETALRVEKVIRDNGAIPATMGIIDGEPIIGMTPEMIEEFGKKKGIAKVSKRDFPVVVANKGWGATTVSGTILMAKAAGEYIDKIIDDAVKECEEKGIKGKDITPFLLAKIAEVTGGKSLDTNIALVLNNAELGAKIAVEYANLKKSGAK